jgi:urease accessory protein
VNLLQHFRSPSDTTYFNQGDTPVRECYEKKSKDDASLPEGARPSMTLTFAQRSKSRGKAQASDDEPVAWFLERGHVMSDGEVLIANDGTQVEIIAATEAASEVRASTSELARAAYHLGNRHLAIQLGPDWVRYQRDHVIDDMIASLGMQVMHVDEPFHPEAGAYSGGGHHHHD